MPNFVVALLLFIPFQSADQHIQDSRSVVIILSETQKLVEQRDEFQTDVNEHMRNLGKLNDQGVVQNAAGIEGGGELIFMNVLDIINAQEIIEADPAVVLSLYDYELLEFTFLKGGLCNPDIPYETSAFDLILFSFKNNIASRKTGNLSDNRASHKDLLDKITRMDEVIMVGQFPNGDGEMVIIQRNTRKQEIINDPMADESYLHIDLHTLWINKGSFCEN